MMSAPSGLQIRDRPDEALVDTSIALALLIDGHDHHQSTTDALTGIRVGLAGHAAFETYSVLTRLPPPARRSADVVARLIATNFPITRHLSPSRAHSLIERLSQTGIAGGAVYDALVADTAREHNLLLLTRDRRASVTYRALQVRFELIG